MSVLTVIFGILAVLVLYTTPFYLFVGLRCQPRESIHLTIELGLIRW